MLFMLPIMFVLCSNMNNINVKILLLECSFRVFTIQEYVCLILSAFQCILYVLLEHIKPFNTAAVQRIMSDWICENLPSHKTHIK